MPHFQRPFINWLHGFCQQYFIPESEEFVNSQLRNLTSNEPIQRAPPTKKCRNCKALEKDLESVEKSSTFYYNKLIIIEDMLVQAREAQAADPTVLAVDGILRNLEDILFEEGDGHEKPDSDVEDPFSTSGSVHSQETSSSRK